MSTRKQPENMTLVELQEHMLLVAGEIARRRETEELRENGPRVRPRFYRIDGKKEWLVAERTGWVLYVPTVRHTGGLKRQHLGSELPPDTARDFALPEGHDAREEAISEQHRPSHMWRW